MGWHRTKEEKLKRIRPGSRYFGFNLGQFYWECLKLEAAAEEKTETDVLRHMIEAWIKTLPPAVQEKARFDASEVESWKAQQREARKDAKHEAKIAKSSARRAKFQKNRHSQPMESFLRGRGRAHRGPLARPTETTQRHG